MKSVFAGMKHTGKSSLIISGPGGKEFDHEMAKDIARMTRQFLKELEYKWNGRRVMFEVTVQKLME